MSKKELEEEEKRMRRRGRLRVLVFSIQKGGGVPLRSERTTQVWFLKSYRVP